MKAQIAIKDGKIVKIARHIDGDAKTVIDAANKVITPGFIDSHSHSDNHFSSNPVQTEKIELGITTSVEQDLPSKENFPWWIIIVAVVVVGGGIAAFGIIKKKKN